MIEAKIVNRGYCMLCGKELTEDDGIFFCKECGYKIRYKNNKRKKELENRFNMAVQNVIDQEMKKKPSLWWKCERCGKLIPYMADFCHECSDEILGDLPKPFDPPEAERNCKSCYNYKNEYCNVLDMKPCYPEKGCDYFSEQKYEREQFIWIVTYWDFDSSEPVVTAFNNEETANKCYKYFKKCHALCYLDKCPIYSRFLESEEDE